MGLFANDNTAQLEALQQEIKKLREGNKNGAAKLAAEQSRSATLEAELANLKVLIEGAKANVLKARRRQKNSVERANRFKLKVAKLGDLTASTTT